MFISIAQERVTSREGIKGERETQMETQTQTNCRERDPGESARFCRTQNAALTVKHTFNGTEFFSKYCG